MKSLAKNSIYNILYKCSNLVFPLVISAYVSRILFAEGIGKVSSAQNIVTYFTLLAALGLPTYGTKIIAACGENRLSRDKAFSELFIINLISTLICSGAYYIIVFNVPYFYQRLDLSIVCGLAIVFNAINVDWFYQGLEEYGYITLRNLIIKLVSLVAVFLFVKTIDDYIVYALILTLSKVANNIFNIIHLRKAVSITLQEIDVIKHVNPVFIFLASSVAIEVYTLADTTMLTFIHGDDIVGYYTTARKSIDVIRTMIVAVCAVYLPRLSYYYANQSKELFKKLVNKAIKILTFITLPATAGVILTAELFVPLLFGNSFMLSIATTQILSFSIITVAFSNFLGYQVLVTIGKEKYMLYSTIVGAIVNIVLNFALVFSLKQNGVAIASAITELCVAIYQLNVVKKHVTIEGSKSLIMSVVFSTVAMSFCVIIIKLLLSKERFLCFALSVVLGSTVYLIITLLCKNEIALDLTNKAKEYCLKFSRKKH